MGTKIELNHEPNIYAPMWVYYYKPQMASLLNDKKRIEDILKTLEEKYNVEINIEQDLCSFFNTNRVYRKYLYLVMFEKKIYPTETMDEVHIKYFLSEEGIDIAKLNI